MYDFNETTKADMLFADLGYQKYLPKVKHGVLEYWTEKDYVHFYLDQKLYFYTYTTVTPALHVAIHEKLKELNWIGE